MISLAAQDIKDLFDDVTIIDLDVGKEINRHGNYLVFDGFKPDGLLCSGVFRFTLYMALKSLRRGNGSAYSELDEIIIKLAEAGDRGIVCECKDVKLTGFAERLFIYALQLEVARSW